ncbi:hypothetical protein I79_015323 [Cricetulus griseus]|uniref:Uncharacterized protein n=1 Tax=Cricetulus griseus TaxID=10029 RepID=G3HWG6_CRIGR|nr:hypothetical protein I79_015323 [Cricetulus griseus]
MASGLNYHTQYNGNVIQIVVLLRNTNVTRWVLPDTATTGLRTFAELTQLCPEPPGSDTATPRGK